MAIAERALMAILRVFGATGMLATVAVFMPRAWMAACHAWLGLGAFPEGPIVEYLARSLSALYAMVGGLAWLVAGDVRRYERVVTYVAVVLVAFGAVISAVDLRLGMPLYWTLGEGPPTVLLGAVMLALQARARAAWRQDGADGAGR